ncbi:probable ATP-dependent RNA helicase DHX40 isoform X2 [Cyprinus carpio]|uniref:Probable ATP-dependent RNA helicase DHX40 isoform X2 n=1 Tax=Cyprinus carpio TaxID=7962 RepID=A0A9Q9X4T3_CYPCA|nr:probable ATP-dependent RNA helicase DHX40 isoform X2 [Cyprinus carpio]
MTALQRSEARQREGRAGRTSAGKCFRIYSKDFWDTCLPEYTIPEIQRTSLTSVTLTLKCLGIPDVIRVPYLDCPKERFILTALKQLHQYDAIDSSLVKNCIWIGSSSMTCWSPHGCT